MVRLLTLFAAGVLLSVLATPAQMAPGDVVAVDTSGTVGLFSIDWSTGAKRTVTAALPLQSVHTAFANDGVIATTSTAITRIVRIDPSGVTTTIATPFTVPNVFAFALDQDRSYALVSADGRMYRLPAAGGSVTTIGSYGASPGPTLRALCRDGERGNLFVGLSIPSQILEVDRTNGAVVRTVSTAIGSSPLVALDYLPSRGEYVAGTAGGVLFIRSDGSIRTTVMIPTSTVMLTVDDKRDRVFAADLVGRITELSAAGTVLASRTYSGHQWAGIDVFDDHGVSLDGSGAAGTTMTIHLRFRRSPNATYGVALAAARRPSIIIGGQRLNLSPDPLFVLTACRDIPGLTSGFHGVTNPSGDATAILSIPPGVVAGLHVFVGALAINASLPGGVDVANAAVVRTR